MTIALKILAAVGIGTSGAIALGCALTVMGITIFGIITLCVAGAVAAIGGVAAGKRCRRVQ